MRRRLAVVALMRLMMTAPGAAREPQGAAKVVVVTTEP
jgi:hypothetical protein